MHCSDLERYLEAHLDGRLGRNRSAILQRHLSACAGCQQRVEELRSFEKELHGKFRTMRATATLWDTLETALVSATPNRAMPKVENETREPAFVHPVQAPGLKEENTQFEPAGNNFEEVETQSPSTTRLPRTAKWLVAATSLVIVGLAGLWSFNAFQTAPVLAGLSDNEPAAGITMRTDDGFILRNWLGNELGYPLPQMPVPPGFELIGGSVVERQIGSAAVVAYDSANGPVMLHVRKSDPELSFNELASTYELRGMQALTWTSERFEYAVFGGPDVRNLGRFSN